MLEVSRVGAAESDDEIELSLELSIGGSYAKLGKLKQVEDSGKENEKGLKAIVPRSGLSFPETIVGDQVDTESGSGSEVVDSRRKREIQALRRQEARRNREEKLRKSAANSKGINGGAFLVRVENANGKVLLETQQLQARARDREMRETEVLLEDLAHKEEKFAKWVTNENGNDSNFTFRNDGNGSEDHGLGSKPAVSFLQNVPVKQMQIPYPQSQSVPQKNGSVYPHLVPCRGPNVGKEENDTKGRNIFQPVTCGSFRPYPNGNGNLNHDSVTGCDSEHNSGKSLSGIKKVMSNGSLERTSSAISDHRSTSGKGGSSSETGSHASCFGVNEPSFAVSPSRMAQPESIASSNKKEFRQTPKSAADESGTSLVSGNVKTVATPKCEEPSTLRPSNGEKGILMPSLPRMPCVSTTGNGPNGKTITGFLYRYTKTEVSIVCVCHGSSFSPAAFVEHAGGTDITNPLRHITMVPSFGD